MTQLLQTDKGANVNGRLNDGSTPLQYASRDGQLAIAEVRPVVTDMSKKSKDMLRDAAL